MSSQSNSSSHHSTSSTERRRKEGHDKYEAAECLKELSSQGSSGTEPAATPEVPRAENRMPDPVQGGEPSSAAGPSTAGSALPAVSRKRPASDIDATDERETKKQRNKTCRKCMRQFETRKIAEQHLQSCDKRYNCDHCPYETSYHALFQRHLEKHAEKPCTVCGEKFRAKQSLTMHMQSHHGELQNRHCDECDKTYSTVRLLQRHIREKHTIVTEQFDCSRCLSSFTTKHGLEIHVGIIHPETRPKDKFRCEICGREFSRKHHLQRHMSGVHHR